MADVGDLRQKAEGWRAIAREIPRLGWQAKAAKELDYAADALDAALRVIEAAEAVSAIADDPDAGLDEISSAWEALDAALRDFREAK